MSKNQPISWAADYTRLQQAEIIDDAPRFQMYGPEKR